MVEKSEVEKFEGEKFKVEKSGVEKSFNPLLYHLGFVMLKNLRGCALNFQLEYKITNLLGFLT